MSGSPARPRRPLPPLHPTFCRPTDAHISREPGASLSYRDHRGSLGSDFRTQVSAILPTAPRGFVRSARASTGGGALPRREAAGRRVGPRQHRRRRPPATGGRGPRRPPWMPSRGRKRVYGYLGFRCIAPRCRPSGCMFPGKQDIFEPLRRQSGGPEAKSRAAANCRTCGARARRSSTSLAVIDHAGRGRGGARCQPAPLASGIDCAIDTL